MQPDPDMDGEEEFLPGAKSVAASSGRDLTSKFRGVCWNKKNKRWQAAVNSGGKYLYLGSYDTQAEAGVVFDKAAVRIRGEKSKLNFHYSDYVDSHGNILPDPQVEALLLEASNPTKVRRQTKKRARGEEEEEPALGEEEGRARGQQHRQQQGRQMLNASSSGIPQVTTVGAFNGGNNVVVGGGGGGGGAAGALGASDMISSLDPSALASLAALLSQSSDSWSHQIFATLAQNPSLLANQPHPQPQPNPHPNPHPHPQPRPHTLHPPAPLAHTNQQKPKGDNGAGSSSEGGGPAINKSHGPAINKSHGPAVNKRGQKDNEDGPVSQPLSSPPPPTDPNAADIALKALAR